MDDFEREIPYNFSSINPSENVEDYRTETLTALLPKGKTRQQGWLDKKSDVVQAAYIAAITSIIVAIITGCFTLASVYLNQRLTSKANPSSPSSEKSLTVDPGISESSSAKLLNELYSKQLIKIQGAGNLSEEQKQIQIEKLNEELLRWKSAHFYENPIYEDLIKKNRNTNYEQISLPQTNYVNESVLKLSPQHLINIQIESIIDFLQLYSYAEQIFSTSRKFTNDLPYKDLTTDFTMPNHMMSELYKLLLSDSFWIPFNKQIPIFLLIFMVVFSGELFLRSRSND